MARTWVVHVQVRVRELEAAVQAYLTAREQAGKPPVEEDILHLVTQYTTFVDPPPSRNND